MREPNSTEGSLTDWDRLADPSDDDIDYSDIPPLDEAFFKEATLRLPRNQQRIASVLRAFKEAHEGA